MSQQTKRFTEKERESLRNLVPAASNEHEFEQFVTTCERTGLDPFSRQIYCSLKTWTNERGEQRNFQVQATIDGFRIIAERSGNYTGQVGPQWCGPDGAWKDAWLLNTAPVAARVGVLHKDFKEPLWGFARYAAYAQTTSIWKKMPELMIGKCAEALALRRAFPQDLSGIYSQEEFAQAAEESKDSGKLPPATPPKDPEEIDPKLPYCERCSEPLKLSQKKDFYFCPHFKSTCKDSKPIMVTRLKEYLELQDQRRAAQGLEPLEVEPEPPEKPHVKTHVEPNAAPTTAEAKDMTPPEDPPYSGPPEEFVPGFGTHPDKPLKDWTASEINQQVIAIVKKSMQTHRPVTGRAKEFIDNSTKLKNKKGTDNRPTVVASQAASAKEEPTSKDSPPNDSATTPKTEAAGVSKKLDKIEKKKEVPQSERKFARPEEIKAVISQAEKKGLSYSIIRDIAKKRYGIESLEVMSVKDLFTLKGELEFGSLKDEKKS